MRKGGDSMKDITFGQYIKQLRRKNRKTRKDVANHLGITEIYLYEIERGNRVGFNSEKISKIKDYFNLSEDDLIQLYDLLGESRNDVPEDIKNYLMKNKFTYSIIRTANKMKISQDDWLKLKQNWLKK